LVRPARVFSSMLVDASTTSTTSTGLRVGDTILPYREGEDRVGGRLSGGGGRGRWRSCRCRGRCRRQGGRGRWRGKEPVGCDDVHGEVVLEHTSMVTHRDMELRHHPTPFILNLYDDELGFVVGGGGDEVTATSAPCNGKRNSCAGKVPVDRPVDRDPADLRESRGGIESVDHHIVDGVDGQKAAIDPTPVDGYAAVVGVSGV